MTPLSIATHNKLRSEFVEFLSQPPFKNKWVAESSVRSHFGDSIYPQLLPILDELVKEHRLTMQTVTGNNKGVTELSYYLFTKSIFCAEKSMSCEEQKEKGEEPKRQGEELGVD